MDHGQDRAKQGGDKQIHCNGLPEQQQKATKRATEDGYRETPGGPGGSTFDYRAGAYPAMWLLNSEFHLHQVICAAQDIPD